MTLLKPPAIRRANAGDQSGICVLVRSQHLDPDRLDWRNFIVAVDGEHVVGTVQLRRHADGSRELGSLAVTPKLRGRGIAARLITAQLAEAAGPVSMVTAAAFAAHYERFGFQRISRSSAPRVVRRRYWIGQLLGGVVSLLRGRRPRPLAILQRVG
jgi:N-acetylglutamate synthase-like GNAT family acetyltransferase